MQTARVFLVEEFNNMDLSNLPKFGKVIYIYRVGERQFRIFTESFREEVLNLLLEKYNFDSEKDYFAFSGSTGPAAIALTELVAWFGGINTLLFNGREYVEMKLGEPYEREA